jgi:hypothetical protein
VEIPRQSQLGCIGPDYLGHQFPRPHFGGRGCAQHAQIEGPAMSLGEDWVRGWREHETFNRGSAKIGPGVHTYSKEYWE